MARRSRRARSRGGGGFGLGGGKVMNGFFGNSGIIGAALRGLGAAAVSDMVPVAVPFKHEAAGFIAGGAPGAAAVFLMKGGASGVTGTNPNNWPY